MTYTPSCPEPSAPPCPETSAPPCPAPPCPAPPCPAPSASPCSTSAPPPASRPDGTPRLPDPATPAQRRAERAVIALYLFFFLLWSAGLCLGLFAPGGTLLGLPLWFVVGGVLSYALICLALIRTIRRHFQ